MYRRFRLYLAHLWHLPHLIRFRLTLWYTGLAAVVLATFVGAVFYSFRQYQFDTYNDNIQQTLEHTFDKQVQLRLNPECARTYSQVTREAAPYAGGSCFALTITNAQALNTGGAYIQFYTIDGKPVQPASDHNGAKSSPPSQKNSLLNSKVAKSDTHTAVSKGTVLHDIAGWRVVTKFLTKSDGQSVIGQIAVPMYRVEQQVDELKHILVYAAAILLVIAAIGGWMLAGRALKPIDEITRRAQQITEHDLSQRLNLDQEDELGRLASTFDNLIARLQEAFERQKRFTSDASHELRTPLAVMQADIGLALARPRSADEYRQTLVSIDEEVDRLSSIINDLLTLTRIDVDPAGMQHQPVALHELLQTLARRVGVIAAERAITVTADHLDPVTVTGDPTRLRQLFTNLLDNAVTYTPDGGHVIVRLESTRDGARVSISDTGIGIAPDDLPRIFERFYRSDNAREQNAHGTGLGLAIARSVAQAHHGDISVQSEVGRGTTFTVTLPGDARKRVRRVYGLRALIPGSAAAR